ncbi:hypothetical protein ACWGA0_00745 [Streptomyces erythrochromogenes]
MPPHNEPWRLPLNEFVDLITFSERTGLTELLHDGDRLSASIDALT